MSRDALRRRLEEELDDGALAAAILAGLDDTIVDALAERAGDDIATSPVLSYRPPTVADDRVDTLWILAFGYRRIADRAGASAGAAVPPMSDLEPGPTNEALAGVAAGFVARRPVPIIAQWEVAHVLDGLGVPDVVSVEPDHAPDGSVVYLSTAAVVAKGLRLAAEVGIEVGRAGILSHADHAQRCVLTAAAAGMIAAVPEGVRLPTGYDTESGQPWTRSRAEFIPLDLWGRTFVD